MSMVINGQRIADTIIQDLKSHIFSLKQKGVVPTLVVILVGDNPASLSYIRQKQKAVQCIGAKIIIIRHPSTIQSSVINKTIELYNNDPFVHGIILQLPLPPHFDNSINRSIHPGKDIDGFVSGSKWNVPVVMAVENIIKKMYELRFTNYDEKQYLVWIKKQNIVIIGRGETSGKPITDYLKNKMCHVRVIHSQTSEQEKCTYIQKADIIISCVGKSQIITKEHIQKGVILISVGISRDRDGNLHGDYEENDIKDIASFYTPTPGGVGPVNVACLMENLVNAAKNSLKTTIL